MSSNLTKQKHKLSMPELPLDMPGLRAAAVKADTVQKLTAILEKMAKLDEGEQPAPMFVRLKQLALRETSLGDGGRTLTLELLAYYSGTGPRIPRINMGSLLPWVTYSKSALLPTPPDAPKHTAHCMSYRVSLDVSKYTGLADAASAITEAKKSILARKAKLVLQARTQLLAEHPEYRKGQTAIPEIDSLIQEYSVHIEKLKALRGTIVAAADQAVATKVRQLEAAEVGTAPSLSQLEDRLKAA